MMEHTANGQQAEFLVVLADQADLSGATSLPTKAEKGRFVYQTLLEKAQTTQEPILQWLRDRNIEHRSFYIVNAILVKGTREFANALAARPEVARIEGNPLIHNDLPQQGPVEKRLCNRGPRRAGDDRAGHRLHARAGGLGARVHRGDYRGCQRRYRCSLDA